MSAAAAARRRGEVESVRKQVVVEAPQERAFRVFTERLDAWWNRAHYIGKAEMQRAVLETRAGGRWYEIGVDGTECEWGKVLVFEPPRRLVLAWQINGKWQYDPEFVTEVEVIFTPEDVKRTRVELEHRDLERFGADAEEVRRAFLSDGGWSGLLVAFKTSADAAR
jgi:uncharacterized protein YndB with AHSA1/START domain